MTLNEMLLRLHRRLGISTGAQDELLTDLLAAWAWRVSARAARAA